MFAATIALLLASHVDFLDSKDNLRICAAGFDVLADRAKAKGSDDINVQVLRAFSAMFAERLGELGETDANAITETKRGLPGSDPDNAVMSRCGAIIGALRGNDTLLDAARKLDAHSGAAQH